MAERQGCEVGQFGADSADEYLKKHTHDDLILRIYELEETRCWRINLKHFLTASTDDLGSCVLARTRETWTLMISLLCEWQHGRGGCFLSGWLGRLCEDGDDDDGIIRATRKRGTGGPGKGGGCRGSIIPCVYFRTSAATESRNDSSDAGEWVCIRREHSLCDAARPGPLRDGYSRTGISMTAENQGAAPATCKGHASLAPPCLGYDKEHEHAAIRPKGSRESQRLWGHGRARW